MPLSAGTRLGTYEITGPLGAGGMGEVYRARDAKLHRDVAIKILPERLASDPAALARFEREAHAVAALSHPNVLSIFDFGRHDGTAFAVTELLEGDTLRALVVDGPLPPRRAVEIARDLALGLAAAHEKGIVHRDLKPENVFVTKDGRVKILDFGLAKETRTSSGAGSQLATVDAQTEPGTVLGTVGYMSPEQVRALPVDARTDVFALGAILYEMLAGRRAFASASSADTMSAILKEDPPELGAPGSPVSGGLERIVRRCLEKSPEQRFRSAADVAFALDAVSGVSLSGASEPRAGAIPHARPRSLAPLLVAAALVAGAFGGFLAARRGAPAASRFRRLTFQRGFVGNSRFTPDGGSVVFTADWDGGPWHLFSARLDGFGTRSLGLPSGDLCAISKGGEIAYLQGPRRNWRSGLLSRVPLGGGAPRALSESIRSADWRPDGGLAVVRTAANVYQIESPIGTVRYSSTVLVGRIALSPDGRIAFSEPAPNASAVCLLEDDGRRRALTSDWSALGGPIVWHRNEVWFSATHGAEPPALHAVDLRGRVRKLLQLPTAINLLDARPDGRILIGNLTWRAELVASAEGSPERDLAFLDWSQAKAISADGKTLLFDEAREGGGRDSSVFVRATDGAAPVRLGEGTALALSPDGSQALASIRGKGLQELVLWPTGAGTPVRIPMPGLDVDSGCFTTDGKRLVVAARPEGKGMQLFVIDPAGAARKAIADGASRPVPAPDGSHVAAITNDGSLALFPLAGGPPRVLLQMTANASPIAFSADGTALFAATRFEVPLRILRVDVATGAQAPFRTIAPADLAGVISIWPVVLTPDAKTMVHTVHRSFSDIYLVEGLE
jgi:tRNA A-37 threonylcarbamoyl transferase component Bud32